MTVYNYDYFPFLKCKTANTSKKVVSINCFAKYLIKLLLKRNIIQLSASVLLVVIRKPFPGEGEFLSEVQYLSTLVLCLKR